MQTTYTVEFIWSCREDSARFEIVPGEDVRHPEKADGDVGYIQPDNGGYTAIIMNDRHNVYATAAYQEPTPMRAVEWVVSWYELELGHVGHTVRVHHMPAEDALC